MKSPILLIGSYPSFIPGISRGSSIDYTYDVLKIPYSFGIELRDNGFRGTLLPSNQIAPSGKEIFAAAKYLANYLSEKYPTQRQASAE